MKPNANPDEVPAWSACRKIAHPQGDEVLSTQSMRLPTWPYIQELAIKFPLNEHETPRRGGGATCPTGKPSACCFRTLEGFVRSFREPFMNEGPSDSKSTSPLSN